MIFGLGMKIRYYDLMTDIVSGLIHMKIIWIYI